MRSLRDTVRTAERLRIIKTPVQRALRNLGYELTPIHASYDDMVRTLIAAHGVDLAIDVGANQGQYATKLRDLGYAGDMHSFEPLDAAFARLKSRADHDPRWTATHQAIGATAGEVTLNISANSVSSSILQVTDTHVDAEATSRVEGTQTAAMVSLDEALAYSEAKSIWLKLDVQGLEGEVLSGAKQVLSRTSVIQTEVSFTELYRGQSAYLEVLQLCDGEGFHPVYVEPGFINPVSGEMLQCDFILARKAPAA